MTFCLQTSNVILNVSSQNKQLKLLVEPTFEVFTYTS